MIIIYLNNHVTNEIIIKPNEKETINNVSFEMSMKTTLRGPCTSYQK